MPRVSKTEEIALAEPRKYSEPKNSPSTLIGVSLGPRRGPNGLTGSLLTGAAVGPTAAATEERGRPLSQSPSRDLWATNAP